MKHRNVITCSIVFALAAVAHSPANRAAETARATVPVGALDDSSLVLESVIVTATRQSTELQSTPVAVSAFSGDYLERANVREFADLMDAIPGVQAPKGLNGAGASITIRGISSNARLGLGDGVEQPAGAYLDQVFVGPRGFLDFSL